VAQNLLYQLLKVVSTLKKTGKANISSQDKKNHDHNPRCIKGEVIFAPALTQPLLYN
jgi:hypothetical protein